MGMSRQNEIHTQYALLKATRLKRSELSNPEEIGKFLKAHLMAIQISPCTVLQTAIDRLKSLTFFYNLIIAAKAFLSANPPLNNLLKLLLSSCFISENIPLSLSLTSFSLPLNYKHPPSK